MLEDGIAVWVMDHEDGVRSVAVPRDAPERAVVDLIIETATAFEMYSYSGGRWMDYGTQEKNGRRRAADDGDTRELPAVGR